MARPVPRRPIAEKEILSFREAADYLSVSRETRLEIVRAGKIPAGKLFTRWRLKKSDIDLYVRTQKNPLVAEAEEAAAAKREALDTAKLLKPKKPRRTITTALLLKHAVETLSTNPCYLVGPASHSLLNTHVTDNGNEWDVLAKGSLAEVLSRSAELFFSEEVPKTAYRRQGWTFPAEVTQALEGVKEHLTAAIAEDVRRRTGHQRGECRWARSYRSSSRLGPTTCCSRWSTKERSKTWPSGCRTRRPRRDGGSS